MIKAILILTGLGTLSLLNPAPLEFESNLLKEESIFIEYTASSGECAVVIQAESETPLQRIVVCPTGKKPITELRLNSSMHIALSGFVLESEEFTSDRIFAVYPEGEYEMMATTADGKRTKGGARLSHDLPPTPVITFPTEGLAQVPTNTLITWQGHPDAKQYTLGIEQNNDDQIIVVLPPGSTNFRIPAGVLAPQTETSVEVGAVGANGNRTVFEVSFETN